MACFMVKLKARISSNPAMWSRCSWVKITASKRFTSSRSICWRKSGPVSITNTFPPSSIKMDERRRLSFSSVERHTSQSHAIIGTPCDVPVPRNVIFKLESIDCDVRNYELFTGLWAQNKSNHFASRAKFRPANSILQHRIAPFHRKYWQNRYNSF